MLTSVNGGRIFHPHCAAKIRYHRVGWKGAGDISCVGSRRPLGLSSLSLPLLPGQRRFRLRHRLGGAEPVPLLQEAGGVRAAREGVRGGARQGGHAAAREHRVAHRAPAERSRLRRQVEPRPLLRHQARRATSARASAGPRRRSNRPATSATRARSATWACASGNIPGAPRRKTTSCPMRTRWT